LIGAPEGRKRELMLAESTISSHRATVTERVSILLRDRILAGVFLPGAPLREEELVREYDVSRHVIREVLRVLSSEGLIEYASFKGARIPVLTERDIHDIYRARRLLECGPDAFSVAVRADVFAKVHNDFARAVAGKDWKLAFDVDVTFHSMIAASTGIERVSQWHRDLLQGLRLAHLVAPVFKEETLAESVSQHAEVVLAIAANDFASARASLFDHLSHAESRLAGGLIRPSPT
jgi:DNA-binding GntR family transcriptional regulator